MSNAKNQGAAERSSGALSPRDLYRVCFEDAPDGMLATDPHGRLVDFNGRGIALTGYSREELLGMALPDLINPATFIAEIERYLPARTKGNGSRRVA